MIFLIVVMETLALSPLHENRDLVPGTVQEKYKQVNKVWCLDCVSLLKCRCGPNSPLNNVD